MLSDERLQDLWYSGVSYVRLPRDEDNCDYWREVKTLIRLRGFPASSDSSLGAK